MKIKIYLMGPPRIEVQGKEVLNKLSKRLLGVLFFLAANQEKAVPKDRLCEVFWDNMDEESARANLRQTLYLIKKATVEEIFSGNQEDALILSETNACRINPALDVWVDVLAFQHALDAAEQAEDSEEKISQLKEAAALCKGAFFHDFSIKGDMAFEEWVILEREQRMPQLEKVYRSLAELYDKRGNYEEAAVALRRLLELDPLLEDAHLQLMKVYYANRERSKAIAQYHQCAKVLSTELNISPMPELRHFYREILGEAETETEGKEEARAKAEADAYVGAGAKADAGANVGAGSKAEGEFGAEDKVPVEFRSAVRADGVSGVEGKKGAEARVAAASKTHAETDAGMVIEGFAPEADGSKTKASKGEFSIVFTGYSRHKMPYSDIYEALHFFVTSRAADFSVSLRGALSFLYPQLSAEENLNVREETFVFALRQILSEAMEKGEVTVQFIRLEEMDEQSRKLAEYLEEVLTRR